MMLMTKEKPEVRSRVELPNRPLTLDDVADLSESDEFHRYELEEGTLVVMVRPDGDHASLIHMLAKWLGDRYGDRLVRSEVAVRVAENTLRVPDIVVYGRPLGWGVGWVDVSDIDLAVEIVSPGSERTDRRVKLAEYAEFGIPRYWIVERLSEVPQVHQHVLKDGTYVLDQVVSVEELTGWRCADFA